MIKNFTFKLFSKNVQIFIDDFQKVNEMNNKLEMELADFILSEKAMERGFEGQTYLLDTMAKVRNYKPATFFSNFQKGSEISDLNNFIISNNIQCNNFSVN